MRWLGLSVILLLLVPFTAALELEQGKDTTIVQDTVTYAIKDGSGVQEAELISNGIELDGDRLQTIIQGGELTVTFIEWDEDARITLESSVPQTITFKWLRNGTRQYFEDEVGLHLDTYRIGAEIVEISLVAADKSAEQADAVVTVERAPWLKRNVFFFILNEETVRVTNGLVLGVVLFINAAILMLYLLRRKEEFM